MKYEISVSDCRTYLHVCVNEPVTPEMLKDFIGKTAAKANESRINNFLFDLRGSDNRTDEFAHYDMVYNQSKKFGFKPNSKHALIINQKDMDDFRFIETILNNAGYQSQMFTDESPAIGWLNK